MYRRSSADRRAEAARYREMTEAAVVAANRADIPTVPLKLCDYDKSRKVLKLASEYFGMPLTFFVRSHHTGKEVRFVVVDKYDVLFDQDQWDGEQQIYRPLGHVPGVDHMIIYHLS